MTFYILRTVDAPFSTTPPETFVVGKCESPAGLADAIGTARASTPVQDMLEVAEVLMVTNSGADRKRFPTERLVPPELERAVAAWNLVAAATVPKLPQVAKAERYIAAYRRFKKRNAGRSFLLEDVMPHVARATWVHSWIHFGWLLGQKDGTENVEKVMNHNGVGKVGRRAAGNGEDFAPREK